MLLAPGETQQTSVRSVGPNDELGDQAVGSLSPRREGPIAYSRAVVVEVPTGETSGRLVRHDCEVFFLSGHCGIAVTQCCEWALW